MQEMSIGDFKKIGDYFIFFIGKKAPGRKIAPGLFT
jgi:hypothetical protein